MVVPLAEGPITGSNFGLKVPSLRSHKWPKWLFKIVVECVTKLDKNQGSRLDKRVAGFYRQTGRARVSISPGRV